MNVREAGAVILAGGQSRRMNGGDKALLRLGGKTFLERLAEELRGFGELLLAVDDARRYPTAELDALRRLAPQLSLVEDIRPGSGSLGGLYSSLRACRSSRLLVVTCDMPLFSFALAEHLLSLPMDGCDALIVLDRAGRRHPLCGVYRKEAASVLEQALKVALNTGDLRVNAALSRLSVAEAPLADSPCGDETILNINTPEDYAALLRI